ncbi:MAG: radical SAM protein [Candidatus Pacearchaeota archaeon]
MVQKVALIDVGTWSPGFHGRLSSLDPLGIEYLGAALVEQGHDVELFQKRSGLKKLISDVTRKNYDVVGISHLTCDTYDAFKVAKAVKEKNRETKIVFGGYHATALPNEVLGKDFVDFVVLGEGENALASLVNSLDSGENNFSDIPNLGWKTKERDSVINPRDFSNLTGLSLWPLRRKDFFEGNKIYGVVYPPISSHKAAAISYSRNCPYACRYCASPWLFGRKARHRTPEDVVSEMVHIKDEYGVDLFFFTDLTFNANRAAVEKLCNLLKGKDLYWCAMCSIDAKNIDEKLISQMAEAGMTRILFGLESFSENVLKAYGRVLKRNRVKYFADLLRTIDKYGIATRCTYMIGEINETEKDLKTYLKLFKQVLPDEMSIKIITPFPGTPLFQEYESKGLILHKQWDKYDTEHLVFKHPSISEETLKRYQYEITKQYYESEEYRNHVKQKIRDHPRLAQSFIDFFRRLKLNGINVNI